MKKFSDEFFLKLENSHFKCKELKFNAVDNHLKIKQDFHSLLAMADKQFMEHV